LIFCQPISGFCTIQRCQENTENLQEWIDEKPERDKHNRISADLKALIEIFDRFERNAETIANARILINLCKPLLDNIKNTLGASDEMYLKLSTRVASQAQSYIIEEVNNAQDNFEYKIAVDRYGTLNKIKTALRAGWEVTNLIGTLDMEYDYKTGRFSQNKNALKNLCNQLDVSTPSYGTSSSSSPSRPSYASTPSSRPTSTYSAPRQPESEGIPDWVKVVGVIIFFVIVANMCGSAKKDDYGNSTSYDASVDTVAVAIDSSASVTDTSSSDFIQNAEIIDSTAVSYDETQSNLKLEDIDGVWYGTGQQFDDNSSWNIKLNINSYNNIYEIEYPDLECKGNLILINNEPGNIVFKEKIYTGLNNCVNNLRAELFIINSNKIKINYYYNGSNELNATGYLTK